MIFPSLPPSACDDVLERMERAYLGGRLSRRGFMQAAVAAGVMSSSLSAWADQLEAIRANQNQRAKSLQPKYDYIVVGTGSAGSALVGRLAAAKPNATILVVEAGDWDTAPSVLNPGVWFTNLGSERDWQDVAIPATSTNGRAIPEHMGKVVGGGSSINATIWARPFKNDLDHWASESGDAKWGYEHGLSIYRRMENWQGKPDARYRGKGGPVWCQPANNPHPLAPAMLNACRSLGMPVLDDLNGRREEGAGGFALMNQIIRDGQRQSMARSYLYPVLAQKNVTLLVKTHVDRLMFAGTRVTGVQLSGAAGTRSIQAGSEVILCSGGINTPKLLMLSGIGNEAHLREHQIKTVVHSPDVGEHFQDHLLHGGCLWEPREHMPHRNSAANASGFIKSDASLAAPDLNLVQIELPYASDVVGKQFTPPNTSWALCAGLVAPKSRGAVRLRSANAADRPIVDARFLSHPDDVKALAHGIEVAREIGNSAAMRDFVKREVAPGRKLSGKEMEDFVRNGATTYFHQAGTCRMGKDDKAVVDAQLRVKGVQNLRIADSSIMPRIAAVATMASCALIGERMAEILS
ncbi:GMC family oxidoreductase N-terminal domain-containing protein [Hydrogenophaga sp. YM1]|uniref:GMC family oxidoreductase n=1 Tax=Hydrogenophaga sp. YM1 TaxID=2806262 RepID=UPI00195BF66E|nr:GMC family oxidoreductase N-terminal domain-containing protein [Hydrogenophaga sp. YM1]QRR32466.1 GMC family oxidoreductase N-terminal domain-containing protein [Hydrogenophaga sp. YM1]